MLVRCASWSAAWSTEGDEPERTLLRAGRGVARRGREDAPPAYRPGTRRPARRRAGAHRHRRGGRRRGRVRSRCGPRPWLRALVRRSPTRGRSARWRLQRENPRPRGFDHRRRPDQAALSAIKAEVSQPTAPGWPAPVRAGRGAGGRTADSSASNSLTRRAVDEFQTQPAEPNSTHPDRRPNLGAILPGLSGIRDDQIQAVGDGGEAYQEALSRQARIRCGVRGHFSGRLDLRQRSTPTRTTRHPDPNPADSGNLTARPVMSILLSRCHRLGSSDTERASLSCGGPPRCASESR